MEQDRLLPLFYKYQGGSWETIQAQPVQEAPVSLTVNGEIWITFMCLQSQLQELMLGFLFTEGAIRSMEEVASVRVCDHQENVDVWLNHSADRPQHWRRTSGCSGGLTADEPAVDFTMPPLKWPIEPEQILTSLAALYHSQDIYRTHGGVHASALCNNRAILAQVEDIGRHNTLDKLAGLILLNGLQVEQNFLLTTGRISSEMLQKVARMGVALVVSRSSPTSLSVQLAQRWGITLVGYARRDEFIVYSHPENIKQ